LRPIRERFRVLAGSLVAFDDQSMMLAIETRHLLWLANVNELTVNETHVHPNKTPKLTLRPCESHFR